MPEVMLKIWGAIVPVVSAIGAWVAKNREDIEAIFLRVQKDAADGLTNEEMEQLAVDMFKEKLYPKMPWWSKLLGFGFWEKRVRNLAKKFCEKSKIFKTT